MNTTSTSFTTGCLLRLRPFRALWIGLIFMSSGVQFYAVVLTWLVLDLTGSPLQVGTVLAVGAVPRAFMMLVSGVIVDRSQPRQLLMFTALGSGLIVGLLAGLLVVDLLTLMILMLAGALMGLMDAFFYPTSFALLPHMLHPSRLSGANAMMQGADGIINMTAPAISGLVVAAFGIPTALALNAGFFLCGALVIRGIGKITLEKDHSETELLIESRFQALMNGFRFAFQHPAIRLGILAIAALNFAVIGPIVVGGAVMVRERFGGESEMYGLFLASFGAGSLVGALIASGIRPTERPGRILIWTATALGISLLVIGFAGNFMLVVVTQFVSSLIVGATMPFFSAWMQQETPLAMQGRIAGLITFAGVAVDPFSQAVVGALSQFSLTAAFVIPGILLLIIAVVLFFNPATHTPVNIWK